MPTPSLKELKKDISPHINPLVSVNSVMIKKRAVRSIASKKTLYDADTGEIAAVTAIHTIEERDDEQFVKVFADGVKAAYSLNRTASRVFQAILTAYQEERMTGGFADCVRLFWFDDGLCGRDIGMSELTFNRGFKDLILKGFLAPRDASTYWVNPALFFKGDRVAFIREYRRKTSLTMDGQDCLPFPE